MNRRMIVLGAFLALLVLAYFLRDVVSKLIILPLFYLWWVIRLYYSMFPQFVVWAILVAFVLYFSVKSLIPEARPRPVGRIPLKPAEGQIKSLVSWLNKTHSGGSYYKWLVANRLGKTAREILSQRGEYDLSKKFEPLNGRDWKPSQEVRDYLDAGLGSSFADFPQSRWFWVKPKPTPLDLDPVQVIEYLEEEMEIRHDRDRKGI